MNVLSKNKKNYLKKKSSEIEHIYSREILLYIAWTCLCNNFSTGWTVMLLGELHVPLHIKCSIEFFGYFILR